MATISKNRTTLVDGCGTILKTNRLEHGYKLVKRKKSTVASAPKKVKVMASASAPVKRKAGRPAKAKVMVSAPSKAKVSAPSKRRGKRQSVKA